MEKIKDEISDVAVEEFLGFKLKMYSLLVDDNSEHKIAKCMNTTYRYTNVDLKICQHLCLLMEIICWQFHIKLHVRYVKSLLTKIQKNIQRNMLKISLLFKKFTNFTAK